jgi:hypothetical protein
MANKLFSIAITVFFLLGFLSKVGQTYYLEKVITILKANGLNEKLSIKTLRKKYISTTDKSVKIYISKILLLYNFGVISLIGLIISLFCTWFV